MHARKKRWRVRVMRKIEDWVDVQADEAEEAEALAANYPQVISVFGKSAISADKPVASTDPLGALGDDDDS